MPFIVLDTKITGYLLNALGPLPARGKASFFLALGYSPERPEEMRRSLLAHPAAANLVSDSTVMNGYGRKLVFECELPGVPNGRRYCVRTVWLEIGTDFRLITAYPRDPQI